MPRCPISRAESRDVPWYHVLISATGQSYSSSVGVDLRALRRAGAAGQAAPGQWHSARLSQALWINQDRQASGRVRGGSMNSMYWKGCFPNRSAIRYFSSVMLRQAAAMPTTIQMCSISFFSPY
jgi:hypothetical protein